jgi:hypothetical protein
MNTDSMAFTSEKRLVLMGRREIGKDDHSRSILLAFLSS